jgi:hypothetical protein
MCCRESAEALLRAWYCVAANHKPRQKSHGDDENKNGKSDADAHKTS